MACDVMPESESAKDYDTSNGKITRRFCRQQEFYLEYIKNPKCLELLKDYDVQHEEVLCFYDEIEKD
eukprot:8268820-Ditylum_brightwellii.AAC.1